MDRIKEGFEAVIVCRRKGKTMAIGVESIDLVGLFTIIQSASDNLDDSSRRCLPRNALNIYLHCVVYPHI